MIKVEKIDVWGFEHAIRGMRNPMNSWDKSDTLLCGNIDNPDLILGQNDLDLMRRLYKAGPEHRKYLRQIFVSMDITAPLYWWKEFDTYKVGTTADSCSTMHKIHAKEFELDDFSHEHFITEYFDATIPSECCFTGVTSENVLFHVVSFLNSVRDKYLHTKDKKYWWQLIQLLPSSYNQKRTVTFTYENVITMIRQRTGHKLDEWNDFVALLHGLPYVAEITEE